MDVQLVTNGAQTLIEGAPAVQLLQSPDDVVTLLEACFEHRVRTVLLYAENLTARFFDLSSGEAGAILQKLRNYHIKLAVVATPGGSGPSHNFQAMMAEERHSNDFRIFTERAAAAAWLLPDAPAQQPAD
ncbi:MAG: DUF4180 domain-containing protein [Chloroflexota bacterium]|nr:DUF4180 domain-containing protein [Chloroflexota bacterium]